MEKLIQKALDEYFSDFKHYHLIILISFTVILAILQITQGILVSLKIEKFKTHLKKSEIKFSRYNELQVEALRNIYQKLVLFNIANSTLFNNNYDKNNHSQYKLRISSWIKCYSDCINQLSLDKILLSQTIIELVNRTLTDFNNVKIAIIKERDALNYMEMEGQGNWEQMYDYSDNELEIINKRIEAIKTNDFIARAEKHIKELRVSIETHFAKMNE